MHYFFLDKYANKRSFSKVDALKLQSMGARLALYLDSNVCVNLERYQDNKLSDQALVKSTEKIIELSRSNLTSFIILPAIYELSVNINDFSIDKQKIINCSSKVFDILNISSKDRNYSSNLFQDDSRKRNFSADYSILKSVLFYYICNLKIVELNLEARRSKKYYGSIVKFIEWCCNDLDYISVHAISLCAKTIGKKSSHYNRMLKIDSQPSRIFKACFSSAFDFFHSIVYTRHAHYLSESGIETFFCSADKDVVSLTESLRFVAKDAVIDKHREVLFKLDIYDLDKLNDEETGNLSSMMREVTLSRINTGKLSQPNTLSASDLIGITIKIQNSIKALKGQ